MLVSRNELCGDNGSNMPGPTEVPVKFKLILPLKMGGNAGSCRHFLVATVVEFSLKLTNEKRDDF
jgi:hypothetical protein